MSRIKQRIKQLEKASRKSELSLAKLKWLAKNVQGTGLIPGRYPGNVDYRESENKNENRE